jgi:hypothetical protein
MTSTTIERPAPSALLHSLLRFTVAVVLAAVLFAGAFAAGRATSPTHTIRSIVTVPVASADGPTDACRAGRAC